MDPFFGPPYQGSFFLNTGGDATGLQTSVSASNWGGMVNEHGYSYTVTRGFEITAPGDFVLSSLASATINGRPNGAPFNFCMWGVSFSAVTSIAGGPTPASQQLSGKEVIAAQSNADYACGNHSPFASDQGSTLVYLDQGAYDFQQTVSVQGYANPMYGVGEGFTSKLVAAVPEPNGYAFIVGIGIVIGVIARRHRRRNNTISG
jgi:hypothetical protein